METEKNEVFTINKNSFYKYSTFVLLGVVILGVAFFVLGDKNPTGQVVNQPGQALPTEPTAKITVNVEGDPIKGDTKAKVTLVEFTDYECPFCQRAAQQSIPILDQYVESGDLRIITKDYPLPFHPQAQKAAESAHCARDQGGDAKYYEMHDLLFSQGVVGGVETFKGYASQLGLDASKFSTCLSSGKFADEVQADLEYGAQIGVQGTPAFFINGRMISGACPAQTFESAYLAEADGDDWAVTNCQFVKL
ncbi:MAG: DsbA family protein [Candidatus Pacearchaeota archaeon]